MAKFKDRDYCQDVLIAVSLEDQLKPGTLEFAIHTLVESRMDTSIFDDRYAEDLRGDVHNRAENRRTLTDMI